MAREVKNDRQEFSRLLSSYASLINENNDLPRLKALAVDLKDRFVCVGEMSRRRRGEWRCSSP